MIKLMVYVVRSRVRTDVVQGGQYGHVRERIRHKLCDTHTHTHTHTHDTVQAHKLCTADRSPAYKPVLSGIV